MKTNEKQVKARPIIFSGDMVRAILDGKKTMTRRIIKPQPTPMGDIWHWEKAKQVLMGDFSEQSKKIYSPYGRKGQKLWVRETFNIFAFSKDGESAYPLQKLPTAEEFFDDEKYGHEEIIYAESEHTKAYFKDEKFISPLFMPRWASRLLLEITDIHVERLQDISEADAVKEGMPPSHPSIDKISIEHGFNSFSQSAFAQTWDSINAKKSYPWDSNPWVWVVEFKVIEGV